MQREEILRRIAGGRTDEIFRLMRLPDWPELLHRGSVKPLQWLVYYDDVTALKAVVESGADLESLDLDRELGNAAFFGHWRTADFLLLHGADPSWRDPETGETALHNTLAKAGRPYHGFVVRLLLERGADPNAATIPGVETGAFMRDVRTRGETPLHRAAAYADEAIIQALLDAGARRDARDAHGASPLTWASEHLRPGAILAQLAFGEHRVGENSRRRITSDHGAGWGHGMEWNFVGDYLPESEPPG